MILLLIITGIMNNYKVIIHSYEFVVFSLSIIPSSPGVAAWRIAVMAGSRCPPLTTRPDNRSGDRFDMNKTQRFVIEEIVVYHITICLRTNGMIQQVTAFHLWWFTFIAVDDCLMMMMMMMMTMYQSYDGVRIIVKDIKLLMILSLTIDTYPFMHVHVVAILGLSF